MEPTALVVKLAKYPWLFLLEYYKRRELIKQLTLRDFRHRFVGSAFGLFWAILQPLAMMAILFCVFKYGLKVGTAEKNVSFISWFFSAVIAWNYFQEVLSANAHIYFEYAYLVKRVNFRLAIMPLIKIFSSLMIHLVFIAIVVAINIAVGNFPSWHVFQLLYYTGAMLYLLFGLSWIVSTVNIFYRDMAQIVTIVTQFGFWATPILWSLDTIPTRFQCFVKLNPMVYIIEGYRKSLVYHIPFWEDSLWLTVYFWVVSTLLLGFGTYLFKRLKKHFADIL